MAVSGHSGDEPVNHIETEFLVGLLTPFETKLEADFCVVAEKFNGVIDLGLEIVRIDHRAQLQLLHPGTNVLVRPFFAFGFLVLELAVINDAAHRRVGRRSDFDQVQPFALGEPKRLPKGQYTERFFFFVEDANFASTDFTVAAVLGFAWWP